MTVDALRRALGARPFTPFSLQLVSGDAVQVPSPEFILLNPNDARAIAVAEGEGFRVVDLLLVEEIKFQSPRRRRAG